MAMHSIKLFLNALLKWPSWHQPHQSGQHCPDLCVFHIYDGLNTMAKTSEPAGEKIEACIKASQNCAEQSKFGRNLTGNLG